jgi:hypothetical protein
LLHLGEREGDNNATSPPPTRWWELRLPAAQARRQLRDRYGHKNRQKRQHATPREV